MDQHSILELRRDPKLLRHQELTFDLIYFFVFSTAKCEVWCMFLFIRGLGHFQVKLNFAGGSISTHECRKTGSFSWLQCEDVFTVECWISQAAFFHLGTQSRDSLTILHPDNYSSRLFVFFHLFLFGSTLPVFQFLGQELLSLLALFDLRGFF